MTITIDEAIKLLEDIGPNRGTLSEDDITAIRLSTEGLKAIKECRASHMFCPGLTLPGETSD